MKDRLTMRPRGLTAQKHPSWLRGIWIWGLLVMVLTGLLSACSPAKHPAAAIVEDYLNALVDKDETRLVSLVCPEYEAQALLELDSFSLVKTRLDGLDCQADAQDGTASVTCQGKILATYGTEDQQFDLSGRIYQVQEQGGDWLICGP
jgi:hypothetical protein